MTQLSTEYASYWKVLKAMPTEAIALAYFTKARWRQGEFCPYCKHNRIYHLKDRKTHKCVECKRCFSITVGTIFEGTKLPVQLWVLAIAYLCEHGGRVGSTDLAKRLGLSQKSAWYMLERLRQATLTLSFQKPLPFEGPSRDDQISAEEPRPRDQQTFTVEKLARTQQGSRSRSRGTKNNPNFRWRNLAERLRADAGVGRTSPATLEFLAKLGRQRRLPGPLPALLYFGDETENATVESVLEQLHRARELAGGMGHPSDLARTEMFIGRLVNQGYKINPDACFLWAKAHRWEDESAVELAEVVERLSWEAL